MAILLPVLIYNFLQPLLTRLHFKETGAPLLLLQHCWAINHSPENAAAEPA